MNKFNNPFHLVTLSPWPLLGSLSLLLLAGGMMELFYMKDFFLLWLGILSSMLIFFQWWRDIVRESVFQGFHGHFIMCLLRTSFLSFIASELLFFASFFWSYFHSMLNPPIESGDCWPPCGIIPFDPYSIPMINSFILITSGMTVTVAHHMILIENNLMKLYLLLTVLLGFVFTFIQGLEYYYAPFSMTDSVYGSLFFMMTGFHGMHVIVGSIFLMYCYYRMMNNHFLPYHHVGFESASWYWHFVDVVWLFLYIVIYWWSS